MKENKKIKYILLILAIVAFIAVIIAGLIYVKETNNEISNLKEQIKKLNYYKTVETSKTDRNTENLNNNKNTENIEEDQYFINDTNLSFGLVNFAELLSEKRIANESSLKLGSYLVNEIKVDEADVSNKDCGIQLGNNNIFKIYMGYGASHYGMYEIKDNKLICKSAFLYAEVGGVKGTNVVFTFDIINNNTLKLENIEIKDIINDNDKLVYEEGFTKGMTYSIK